MSMRPVKSAVIGVGYLGKFHAQKYAELPEAELVAVIDTDAESRERIAAEHGVPSYGDFRDVFGLAEAVSIVVPTPLHYPIAKACLENGIHVLLEKPMAATVDEAQELIEVANDTGRLLQIGHLERFNSAIVALGSTLKTPRFIESNRLAPFKERGTDVNVVLDLMIHDIDIIQNMVRSPIAQIDAIGTSVFSKGIDIANARINFENGCVVNTTASRVSLKTERKIRLFQDDAYISIDMQQKILTVVRKADASIAAGVPQVAVEERSYEQGDALKLEVGSFIRSIQTDEPPVVSGEDGKRALETAIRITEMVQRRGGL